MQVTKVRCMKCEVWGHSHTDKNCPRYGKAKDSDQPILQVRLRGIYVGNIYQMTSGDMMFIIFCVQVDPDILMRKMREQGLRLNHTNVWDNGRRKGKQYDLGRRDNFILHIQTLFCRSYYEVLCLFWQHRAE